MKNLVHFIIRYHVFLLFLLLQVFSFYLITRYNKFHHAGFMNSSNLIVGKLFTWKNDFTSYFELKDVNDKLATENAALRNKLRGSYEIVNEHFVMIDDTLRESRYQYLQAEVVNNSINRRLNYLTLNKGSREGIKPEMGVISDNGIVGIVKDVSYHFSTVVSVLNLNFTVGVRLEKSKDFGLLKWEEGDPRYAYVIDIAKHVEVKPGDKIVTRGNSAVFPKDIPVGEVIEVTDDPGSNYLTIKIQLASNFSSLHYVYIVSNLFKEEQEQLESQQE